MEMEYMLLLVVALCFGSVVYGQGGGPMPLPMPGAGNGPMNPFLGPQQATRPRDMNMDQRNRNNNNMNNRDNMDNRGRGPMRNSQPRSQTDQMLDNMGLGGIQPFYAALAGELTRSPNGMGMGGQEGMQGRY